MQLKMNIPDNWFLRYMGKPWKANPEPPESYNCGELVRSIYYDLFGITTSAIPIENTQSMKQCLKAMQPEIFDLLPLSETDKPRNIDVAFMGRKLLAHCGVAVETSEGLKILHCPEAACGVCIDGIYELKLMGFGTIKWFRHKDLF